MYKYLRQLIYAIIALGTLTFSSLVFSSPARAGIFSDLLSDVALLRQQQKQFVQDSEIGRLERDNLNERFREFESLMDRAIDKIDAFGEGISATRNLVYMAKLMTYDLGRVTKYVSWINDNGTASQVLLANQVNRNFLAYSNRVMRSLHVSLRDVTSPEFVKNSSGVAVREVVNGLLVESMTRIDGAANDSMDVLSDTFHEIIMYKQGRNNGRAANLALI